MTAIPDPDPGSAPGWTDDQLDRLIRQFDVLRLNDDFERAGWHAWLSRPSEGRPARVCATRATPTHPCEPVCTDPEHRTDPEHYPSKPFTGCGETIDADTPDLMRDLLTARAAS
jgi:hypothetical protein